MMFRKVQSEALALGALIAALVALYLPVFDNGFVYDDFEIIVMGDVVHDPSKLWDLFTHHAVFVHGTDVKDKAMRVDTYRPLSLATFMWDAALSGRQPWAYHLTNLVLHLLSVCALYLLLRHLFGRRQWPLLIGVCAWFGVTPHPATAHIWINGRSDLLIVLFGISALLAWRRAIDASGTPGASMRAFGLHTLSALLFLGGLLCKELTLTLLMPALLWPESQPVPARTRVRRIGGLLLATLVYLGLRSAVLGGMRASQGGAHLLRSLAYLAPLQLQGLIGALTPHALHLRYLESEFSQLSTGALAAQWVGALLALAAVIWGFRRAPLVCWGLLWFGATLTPVALVASVPWPGFGRYLYLPCVGLAVSLVGATRWLPPAGSKQRSILAMVAGLYLVVLAVHLRGWIRDFRTPERLYASAIAAHPDNPHLLRLLGIHYLQSGHGAKAVDPLARAHQLDPGDSRNLEPLMEAFEATGQLAAAARVAREGVERYGADAEPFHMLLMRQTRDSDPRQACWNALECLRKNPGSRVCGDAFTALVTVHPLAKAYREAARQILARPEMATVARQVRPLMDSLH